MGKKKKPADTASLFDEPHGQQQEADAPARRTRARGASAAAVRRAGATA